MRFDDSMEIGVGLESYLRSGHYREIRRNRTDPGPRSIQLETVDLEASLKTGFQYTTSSRSRNVPFPPRWFLLNRIFRSSTIRVNLRGSETGSAVRARRGRTQVGEPPRVSGDGPSPTGIGTSRGRPGPTSESASGRAVPSSREEGSTGGLPLLPPRPW